MSYIIGIVHFVAILNNLLTLHYSPCASKPIKQRVEAFEKLQTPQKETRTRTRILTTESEVRIIQNDRICRR